MARRPKRTRYLSPVDNASTTGQIINPVGSVVPYSGGGSTGGFGSGLPVGSGAGAQQSYLSSVGGVLQGAVTPTNRFYQNQNLESAAISNRSGFSGNGAVSVTNNTANLINKGGNVNPSLAPLQNSFAGMYMGGGAQGQAQTATRLNPAYKPPAISFDGLYGNNTGTAGYWGGYQPLPQYGVAFQPQTGGMLSPDKNPLSNGYLGASNYLDPAWQQQGQQNQQISPTAPQVPQPPNVPIQGNFAVWQQYWNATATFAAQNPQAYAQATGGSGAPAVMSRREIWNMKANQRRRRMAKSEGDDNNTNGGGGGGNPVPQPERAQWVNPWYSTTINTGK